MSLFEGYYFVRYFVRFDFLFDRFTETRDIRQSIVDARQAGQFIPTEGGD